jgi:quinol monooxygenase YgiN
MIIVTATITAKQGERDKIISKSRDVIEHTRLESGCISYNLYAHTEDDDVLMMFEQWKSPEMLKTHMETEHFQAFGVAIEDLTSGDIDITVYSADKYGI